MSDRTPLPHDIEAEQSALGAMLLTEDARARGCGLLKTEAFYRLSHQKIFDVLNETDTPCDMVTIKHALKKRGHLEDIGGTHYLTDLTEAVTLSQNIDHYAQIVNEKHAHRQLYGLGSDISRQAKDGIDAKDIIAAVWEKLEEVEFQGTDHVVSAGDAFAEALEKMSQDTDEHGPEFGIPPLDCKLAFGIGDMVVISGESSSGKSSLLYHLLWNCCHKQDFKGLLFTPETSRSDMMRRMTCQVCQINTTRTKRHNIKLTEDEYSRMQDKCEDLETLPLRIDGKTDDVDELLSRAVAEHQKHPVDIIAIDYAQEFGVLSENKRVAQVISKVCKRIIRRTGAMVVLLSQLTQLKHGGVRTRGGDEIRNKADHVLVIKHPATFGQEPDMEESKRNVIVAKGKDVEQCGVMLDFYGPHLTFSRPDATQDHDSWVD